MYPKPSLAGAPQSLCWLASISLFTATVLALSNLPAEELPTPWLLAFTVPGAIIGSWSRIDRPRWLRMILAVALQAGACYGALEWVGQMTRPAALACTILPPLAFLTTRNHDADPSLALFLSFCVLLVGMILDGLNIGMLMAYGACATLSLHVATLLESYRACKPTRIKATTSTVATEVMATTMILLACMVAVFAIERTLGCLPAPSHDMNIITSKTTTANRAVGLSDSFILDGTIGIIPDLTDAQLLRVTHPSNKSVASNLYLRCGFFTEPSMGRWNVGTLSLQRSPESDPQVLRRPALNIPLERIDIEQFGKASQFVFLPPHSMEVIGLKDLLVDNMREWVRPKRPNTSNYQVTYQNLPAVGQTARVDARLWQMTMTQLPRRLDKDRLNRLLDKWSVTSNPMQAMDAIAKGLARHCQYSRSQPTGPHQHEIHNFLFADVDRHGYCMHFATAAALMLRMRNIPCRIGVGLYGGVADNDVPGSRTFGSQHAHAWVEVPFKNRGFVVFDPTPPEQRNPAVTNEQQPAEISEPGIDVNGTAFTSLESLLRILSAPATWVVFLVALILSTLISRKQPRQPKHQRFTTAPKARRALQKILQVLAQAGHPRHPDQTLEVYAAELSEQGCLPKDLQAAFVAYQEARFGGHSFDHARASQLTLGLKAANAMSIKDTASE